MRPIEVACNHQYAGTAMGCPGAVGVACVAMGLERGMAVGEDGAFFHSERRMTAAMCGGDGIEIGKDALDEAVTEMVL